VPRSCSSVGTSQRTSSHNCVMQRQLIQKKQRQRVRRSIQQRQRVCAGSLTCSPSSSLPVRCNAIALSARSIWLFGCFCSALFISFRASCNRNQHFGVDLHVFPACGRTALVHQQGARLLCCFENLVHHISQASVAPQLEP
jgi:hypothetical protein